MPIWALYGLATVSNILPSRPIAVCRAGRNDPKQQIEGDYEPTAIKQLSELAEAFNDDYPTKKLILKWIDGEKEHMAWEAQYLNYTEKLGYENFLAAMM